METRWQQRAGSPVFSTQSSSLKGPWGSHDTSQIIMVLEKWPSGHGSGGSWTLKLWSQPVSSRFPSGGSLESLAFSRWAGAAAAA